jgi:hypothetical protein
MKKEDFILCLSSCFMSILDVSPKLQATYKTSNYADGRLWAVAWRDKKKKNTHKKEKQKMNELPWFTLYSLI